MVAQDMFDEPTQVNAIIGRFKTNPFLSVGCVGFLVTAGIGAYKFKTRPKNMSAGSYIVQLRVLAQSIVVGSLTVGMVYHMIDDYLLKKKTD